MTTNVEKTITVDAPLSAVYNQWTQFEEFPQFMGGVQQVTQLSDDRLHWVAEIAGVKREWDAQILEQVPDTKVAWAAVGGATNAGAVTFTAMGASSTLVRLSLDFEPEGLVEKAGDALNIVGRQAESDLEKFKTWFEARGLETGGWRGTVNEGASVGTPGVEDASASQGDSGKAGLSAKTVAAGVVAGVAGVAGAAAAAKAVSGDSGRDDTTIETVPVETTVVETTPVETVTTTASQQSVDQPVVIDPVADSVEDTMAADDTSDQAPPVYDPNAQDSPGRPL
jgi:carbon monoxide dehydrogenase subunit G